MKDIGDSNSNSCIHSDNPLRPYSQDSRSHTSCTHPHSISSIMSSMSFQTFTSFIPLSWSSSQRPLSVAPPTSPLSHSTPSSISKATAVPDPVSSRKRGYVSRKKQLQLLRAQMELEGVRIIGTPVQCKKCVGDLVFI
jgi:hypothetical protein